MNSSYLLAEVAAFYHARLVAPAARDLAPPPPEVLARRFAELAKVGDVAKAAVVGDYGCGGGALLGFLRAAGFEGEYRGYDMVPSVVGAARCRHAADGKASFSSEEGVLAGADFVLASGIFNVKLATPTSDWEAHLRVTLDRMAARARRGFAFNALSDSHGARPAHPECYYADPARLLDLCERRYSREAALLSCYGLDEFTILVRR